MVAFISGQKLNQRALKAVYCQTNLIGKPWIHI